MAEPINKIEDVETVYVAPSGGENVEDPNAADEDAGAEGDQEDEGEGSDDTAAAGQRQPKEQLIDNKNKPVAQAGQQAPAGSGDGKKKVGPDGLTHIEGESPRERALRGELAIARGALRKERGTELGIDRAPGGQTPQQSQAAPTKNPEREAELAKKYGPQALANLREVLPVLADELGYVKATDLSQQTYTEQAQGVLDHFLESHPEYSAENDKDGVLWKAFTTEYGLYNKPANPKDFQKIFNRIHTTIFGIKPAGDKGALNAAQQKINVASHAGASGPSRSTPPARSSGTPGLRLDMLKGFSDDEKDSLGGEG